MDTRNNDQVSKLEQLIPGDVVFGVTPGGSEKLLLVYRVTADEVHARHVTTQVMVRFDIGTGKSNWVEGDEDGSCQIISVAPLDPRNTVLSWGWIERCA